MSRPGKPHSRRIIMGRMVHRARMLEQDAKALYERLGRHKDLYGAAGSVVELQARELADSAQRMTQQLKHEIEYGRFT